MSGQAGLHISIMAQEQCHILGACLIVTEFLEACLWSIHTLVSSVVFYFFDLQPLLERTMHRQDAAQKQRIYNKLAKAANVGKSSIMRTPEADTFAGSTVLPSLALYPGFTKEKLVKPTASFPEGRAMPTASRCYLPQISAEEQLRGT